MARASAKPKIDKTARAPRAPREAESYRGARRNTSRTMRAFDAGRNGRRLRSIPTTSTAINSQIRKYGKNVVARSRYLAINNPYAAAAKEAYVSALVGCGIKPSPLTTDAALKKEIARVWRLSTDEMDADGLTDFYGLQSIIAGEMFEAGECFVRIRKRLKKDGLTVPMQLQLLPMEMLPTDHNEVLRNGGRIECGIEFDAIGRRVAYWFYRVNPNDTAGFPQSISSEKVRVPAEEVLHLFKPIRAGQIRGVPFTLAGIVTLAMIDLYDDAELERKRVAALFGAFVTRNGDGVDEDHPFGELDTKVDSTGNSVSDFTLEPGAVVDLEPGQSVEFAEPADVGSTYEAFQYRNLLRAAAGFGVTYADMTGDLRQTSYGSIRAGLVAFRRRIESHQHFFMVFQFCRVVWKTWFDNAVLYGAIKGISPTTYESDPLTFRDVKWIPPKWEWIDPLKDRQAEKLAVDSGFKPRSDVIEAEGYDPEEVDARIAADQERAGKLGIKFITLSTTITVSPTDEDEGDSLADTSTISDDSGDYDFG